MKLGYLCHPGMFATGGPGARTASLLAAFAHLDHEVHVRTHTLPDHLHAIRHAPDAAGLEFMTRAIDVCLVRLDGSCHAERLAAEAQAARPLLPIVLEIQRNQSRCNGDNSIYYRLVRESVVNVRQFVNFRS